MSIFRRIEIAVAVILLLLVAGLVVRAKYLDWRRDVAQENYQVANGDAKAAETTVTGLKRIAAAKERKHEELERAVEANPEWASQPVPSDIARVLCHSPDAACAVHGGDADH